MKRKILTTILVVVLAFVMMIPAMADTTIPGVLPGQGNLPTETPGTGNIEGEGDVEWAEMPDHSYSFILSTSEHANFQIDPMGLLGAADGSIFDPDNANPHVIFHPAHEIVAINNSSVPVMLTASAIVTGTGVGPTGTVLSLSALEAATATNSLFWIVPSLEAVTTTAADLVEFEEADDFSFAGITRGIPFGNSTVNVRFLLPLREHNLLVDRPNPQDSATLNRVIAANSIGTGTAFELGGLINTDANWSSFAGDSPDDSLGVRVDFTVAYVSVDGPGRDTTILHPNIVDGIGFNMLGNGTEVGPSGGVIAVSDAPNWDLMIDFADPLFPEPWGGRVGFAGGATEYTVNDHQRGPNNFRDVPFNADGGTVTFQTIHGAAPLNLGYDAPTSVVWFSFAANAPTGWRHIVVTVTPEDGSPAQTFDLYVEVIA